MIMSDREIHLLKRAVAVALEVFSRAHPRHTPRSNAQHMAELYFRLVPTEEERIVVQHSIRWLLAGGLDLREREVDPLPISPSPTPPDGGGETIDDGEIMSFARRAA